MIVLLDYYKAKTVDLKEYYDIYDNHRASYKLLNGAPILVNAQGRYIKAFDIPELVVNRNQRVLSAVNKWIMELKSPSNVTNMEILEFRWKR